uniref:aspartate aminotransferase family protein n=1 Tax=Candidatus Fimivicinus sp. TaxID=3056640 RepID=UPI003FEFF054
MTYEEIKNMADQYLMPTYAHFNAALVKGKGAQLFGPEGESYLDFTAGIGVSSLGYGDAAWAQAVAKQASLLAHTSNLYYNPVVVEAAKLLCEKSGFARVFFANSGAEANECAMKLARKYSFDTYGAGRSAIVTLKNSFHGRTMETLTATGQDELHQYFDPFPTGFRYTAANDLDALKAALDDTVCAVMMEPVQGEGGVQPLDADFVHKASELCREKDILLIFDEVQTGVGRTGRLYAWEQFGVRPDILTSAKGLGGGLPVGACLCVERLGSVMGPGTHGSTFGGNPVVCAGVCEVLSRMDEALFEQVRQKGEFLRETLSECDEVAAIRGMGLMLGLVLKTKRAKEVASRCVDKGLLVLTAKTLVRLLPPLTISQEELEQGIAILKEVLTEK